MSIKSLTLRNYRSFGEHGATLPIGPQFVALLGVNNSGKSSLLKSFYELRSTFGDLAMSSPNDGRLVDIFRPNGTSLNHPIVTLGAGERIEQAGSAELPRITIELDDERAEDADIARAVELVVDPGRGTISGKVRSSDGTWLVSATGPREVETTRGREVTLSYDTPGGIVSVPWSPIASSFATLADSMYVPAFRNAINQGSGEYYDVSVGTGFVQRFEEMKSGDNPANNEAIRAMLDKLGGLLGLGRFDIDPSPGRDRLVFSLDGISLRGTEVGAGVLQFAIVASNVFVRRPSILLVDEPELNLHARLQAQFLELLAEYTAISVIYATHSLGLARSTADRLLVTSIDSGRSRLDEYNAAPTLASALGELGYGGRADPNYRAVVLVEGVNDVRAMQQLLLNYAVRGCVAVLSLGGGSLIASGRDQELAELRRLSDEIFVIIDSERTSKDEDVEPQRLAFVATCEKLNMRTMLTERRALENYFTHGAIEAVYGETVAPFGLFDKPSSGWDKRKNWRVARFVTSDDLGSTDLGDTLRLIADRVV